MLTAHHRQGIAALRRFVRAQPVEGCELCGMPIPSRHGHILEPAARRVFCVCLICGEAVTGRADRRYHRIPEQAEALSDFRMSNAEWHGLGLPIDMAFLYRSTPEGRPVALYPGPLGAAEALVGEENWRGLTAANPVLAGFEPDVETLLIDRLKGRRAYYRVPIDRCYALVGVIRTHWQGMSGGDAVWQAIDDFLAALVDPRAARAGSFG
jgi:hypothetical protein